MATRRKDKTIKDLIKHEGECMTDRTMTSIEFREEDEVVIIETQDGLRFRLFSPSPISIEQL